MRVLTGLLLTLIFVASAATVTFQPDPVVGKDADCTSYYLGDGEDTNYGNSTTLSFGQSRHGFDSYLSLIEFTELNDPLYQGVTVASASLWLYINDVWGGYGANRFRLKIVTSAWDEDTVTWNNQPGCNAGFTFPFDEESGWCELDVTDYVQLWLDGTRGNYGFKLLWTGERAASCYSSDYSDATKRPKLVMEYYGVAVEETTWGEIKATF